MTRSQAVALGLVAVAIGACSDPVAPIPRATPQLTLFTDSLEVRVSPTRAPVVTATVLRLDVPQAVTVRASGVPAGVVATVGEVTHDGQASTVPITLTGDVTADPGLYTVTLTASAPGASDATSQFKVRVAELVRVSFAACAPDQRPLWFGWQDGSGPLRQVTASDHRYAFAPDSSRAAYYHVAWNGVGGITTRGELRLADQLLAAPIEVCEGNTTGSVMVGDVIGVAGDRAILTLGGPSQAVLADGQVSLLSGPGTTHNLVVGKSGTFFSPGPNRLLLRRNVDVTTGSLGTISLHFGAPDTWTPVVSQVTLSDTSHYKRWQMELLSGASCTPALLYERTTAGPASTYWGFPVAALAPTDWHVLDVSVGLIPRRWVSQSLREVGPLAITFGAIPEYPEITHMAEGSPRLSARFDVPPQYRNSTRFHYEDNNRAVELVASHGWLSASGHTITPPDFSAAPGWDTSWDPPTNVGVYWESTSVGSTGGSRCRSGFRTDSVTFWGTAW